MALASLAGILPRLLQADFAEHATTDAELLDRFLATRDAIAFESLVRRHGPMVFAVCKRVLRNTHDAEDAFQATFVVLAFKAASVTPRAKLASWLHGVAYKTALKARHRAVRRSTVESQAPTRSAETMPLEQNTPDPESILDQELAALPDRYRVPIVLCDLEGRLRSEVATTLGCSEGTLSSRLTRGRRLLAERLKRRGVHTTAGTVVTLFTQHSPAIAESLVQATVPAALNPTLLASISPTVAQLATGVMKSMFLKKLQTVAVAVFAVIATTALTFTGFSGNVIHAAPVPKAAPPALDDKAVTEAITQVDGHLLLNRKVLKELKCDIDQLDKIMDRIEAAEKKSQEKTNQAMMQLKFNPNPAPGAFEKMIQEAQEAGTAEFRKATAETITKLLSPAQQKRLVQIDLQVRGYDAFTLPVVAKALDLTAKQKEDLAANVKQVATDVQTAIEKPGQNLNPNIPVEFDFEKLIKEVHDNATKRALAILTDDQKTKWKAMTGEPFTHPINRQHHGIGFDLPFGGIGGGNFQVLPALPALPPVPVEANPVPVEAKPEK